MASKAPKGYATPIVIANKIAKQVHTEYTASSLLTRFDGLSDRANTKETDLAVYALYELVRVAMDDVMLRLGCER